jgi:hypothetical protein
MFSWSKLAKSDEGRLAIGTLVSVCLLLLVTIVAPDSGAAGLALVVLVAALGAALTFSARRWSPPSLPAWSHDWVVTLAIGVLCVHLFAPIWDSAMWRAYDWGPHHANLKYLVDALREGHVPRWVHGVSTGDSPYELYPLLPYYLAARIAIWTDTTDLTLVMLRGAILIHSLSAVSAALLARRLLSVPWALLVGVAILYDDSSVWAGGAGGVLHMGVTHAALANAIWSLVLLSVVDALRRPSWSPTIRIWLFTALALACHPLAFSSALATCAALLVVSPLAFDVRAHRTLTAMVHVLIGVGLCAVIWLPLTQRLTLYGVHFSLAGVPAWELVDNLMRGRVDGTITPLLLMGYVGVIVALLSRCGAIMLTAVFAATLLAGLVDQPYVLLDLAPSHETARFQTTRLLSSAKPCLLICGAFLVSVALSSVRARAAGRNQAWLGAALALIGFSVLRGFVPFADNLRNELHQLAQTRVWDAPGLKQLSEWARQQNEALPAGRIARLLHEDHRRFYSVYHVGAASGLPTLWPGPVSCLFLRERIEDTSAESLRRFNVRWVMRLDKPPSLGDPDTELRFGRYFVRELSSWDGQFARVERGGGYAVVSELEDERVVVELRDTSTPSLVALGMGYYPRWQATHEASGALETYALPSMPEGTLSVLSAWLPPGRTVFSPTGALASDAAGWWASLLALLAVASSQVIERRKAWRFAALKTVVRGVRWCQRHARRLSLAGTVGGSMALVVYAVTARTEPAGALQLGNALLGAARVQIETTDGEWSDCDYSMFQGGYRCDGTVLVQDTMADLLDDAPPSPPFSVPAILATSQRPGTRTMRVTVPARLSGAYWAAATGGSVSVSVGDRPPVSLSPERDLLQWALDEAETITIEARFSHEQRLKFAVVRRADIDVDRNYPQAPQTAPF